MDFVANLMYVVAMMCLVAVALLVAEAIYRHWKRSWLLRWAIVLLVIAGWLAWVLVS
jgi:hypothetical protein